ncbi:uncharacterized protein LOC143631983 [Bidens hawaiensis]|uniref:uncharacterized protein LOC143631983 n=1 Tax=Bidens hawaiensis TaxID=980011 RepID=UPI004049BEAB
MQSLLSESKTPITSSKRKSVFLREWWLIKADGESQLAVGGFVNRETLQTRGMRLLGSASTGKRHNNIEDGIQVYGSAAIAKRHDNNTLEAVDGVIIMISGCINKSRTLSHGFSPEVCDGFLSGFLCNWEDYASKSFHDKCPNTTNQSLSVSFDDLPITRVRDLLMSETESRAAMSIVFADILKHTEISLHQSVPSTEKNPIETEIDQKQDAVSLSNDLKSTKKITEDAGFMSGEMRRKKKTKEKQLKELPRRYQLRSMRKRKRT